MRSFWTYVIVVAAAIIGGLAGLVIPGLAVGVGIAIGAGVGVAVAGSRVAIRSDRGTGSDQPDADART